MYSLANNTKITSTETITNERTQQSFVDLMENNAKTLLFNESASSYTQMQVKNTMTTNRSKQQNSCTKSTDVCICVYMYICKYIQTNMCIYIHIYIYIYTLAQQYKDHKRKNN